MDAAYVFDTLGEPLNEGDIVIYENMGWIITKISVIQPPAIMNPATKNQMMPQRSVVSVTMKSEFTTAAPLGERLVAAYKAAKKMSPGQSKGPDSSNAGE